MIPLVVIPAYNEAATLGRIVERARRHAPVLVVDDGSDDGSARIAAAAGADVVRHPRRCGKASALRTGIAAATARQCSVVITLDGDGQHEPDDLPALLAAARETPEAIVVGCRRIDDRFATSRRNAMRVAAFFVEWITELGVTDTQSGFRAYPIAFFREARPRWEGFVFETEVLIAAARHGWRVREVPITSIPSAARPSRFRAVHDGLAIGAYLTACSLARWRRDVVDAAGEIFGVFRPERRCMRHAAMLEASVPYAGSLGAWSVALGTAAARRASARLRVWWDHPRRQRAEVAARATALAPVLLGAAILQALLGRGAPDVVSPLVVRAYEMASLGARPRAGAPRAIATGAPMSESLVPPRVHVS